MQVTMTVNGTEYSREVEPRMLLVHFIRDELRLRGTHWGCDTSNCGTCVIWVDNEPVKSCTMLAVMAALKAYKAGDVSKIVITRPAVGVDDEKHGFLPGDLNTKMEPWTRPIMDVMQEYYSPKDIAKMLDEQQIEISPLAFMRGRNLKDAFVICDEMQNASINQMKMVLTRLASNSKMVITGDLNPTDKQFIHSNGLLDFIERLKESNSRTIAHTNFNRKDVQRHPVVAEVLSIYGEE